MDEETEVDPVSAQLINVNLADYMVPVNADAPPTERIMIPEKSSA